MDVLYEIMRSWSCDEGIISTNDEIVQWIDDRNRNLVVNISKVPFQLKDGFWYLDPEDGFIKNRNNSFFQLSGLQESVNGKLINEQPVILQDEIGFLGIIAQIKGGVLHFLMQAKIEPGNVNKIQISPTIQATKSNFTRKHGGKAPAYLDYFISVSRDQIIVDQIQSEQSSRFFKKRNRNIIILVNESEEIEVLPSHKWMTLGQIKNLLYIDNVVNMDTRTVLSCIPFCEESWDIDIKSAVRSFYKDPALYDSMYGVHDYDVFHHIMNKINNEKMFSEVMKKKVPLDELSSWSFSDTEFVRNSPYDFKVIYCKIEIEGREVRCWEQPLVEACGKAVLGLFTRIHNGKREFLVQIKREPGCFDIVELGPTIQKEPTVENVLLNNTEKAFLERYKSGKGIMCDVMLSEEGGRFYHEQNRNIIIEVSENEIDMEPWYCWADYFTLNRLIQFNNQVNIQLRNLLTLMRL